MVAEKVVPTERELGQFDLNSPDVVQLIHHAEEGDAADRLLTVKQALRKYKKAVAWAMFLSTSLIMEGYDLSMVCTRFSLASLRRRQNLNLTYPDIILLRTDTVQKPLRCHRLCHRREAYYSPLAVRSLQLSSGGPAGWTPCQCLQPRSLWSPTHHVLLYGMDGSSYIHSCLRTVFVCSGLRRGYVRRGMGCLPGASGR